MTEESAAAGDQAQAEVGAEIEPENESLWASFNRADMKLFIVTFAGTLAANVMTVTVVAVALLIARPLTIGRPTERTVLSSWGSSQALPPASSSCRPSAGGLWVRAP